MGFLDKVKNLVSKNADKVDTAIDKAGDLVDKKTQGKYAGQVDKVQDAAKKAARDNAGGTQQPAPQPPQPAPQPPQAPPPPAAPAGPPPTP
jgi:hypothetical protein